MFLILAHLRPAAKLLIHIVRGSDLCLKRVRGRVKYISAKLISMNEENRQLVTDEPVEFEK